MIGGCITHLEKEFWMFILRSLLQSLQMEFKNSQPGVLFVIGSAINHFKHHYYIWYTRHCFLLSALTHLMAGIVAYVIEPLKISAIKLLASNNYLT